MAGDWLKVEKGTRCKREVYSIGTDLGISRQEAFDLCLIFWEWADASTEDGVLPGMTTAQVDDIAGRPGFADALLKVCWLQARSGSLVIPNFARHMGQSAKKRLTNRVRKMSQRMSRKKRDKGGTSSISISHSSSNSSAFIIPTLEEIKSYCAERRAQGKPSVDPEQFLAHYTANGWVQGNRRKPIIDWKAAVVTWEKNSFRHNVNHSQDFRSKMQQAMDEREKKAVAP